MKVVVTIAAACALAAGFVVAGWAGLLVSAGAVAVASLFVRRAAIPAAPSPPRRSGRRTADDGTWPFASYRRIRAALGWAGVSARHYDRATRPVLIRLAPDPERARLVLGEDLWPLIDPDRPASSDSDAPGVDVATLTRIVDRLEQL
jgi:hypothetical protein